MTPGSAPRTATADFGDRRDEGDHGDGDEEPGHPAYGGTGRQGDEDEGRMDVDGPPVHDRHEDVPLEHVHDRDEDEEDDGCPEVLVGERHGQQDERREHPADVGDEAGEEDEDRQRPGQGHAEDDEEEEVADRVAAGDDGRTPEVAADPLQGVIAGRQDLFAAPVGDDLESPCPGLVAVRSMKKVRRPPRIAMVQTLARTPMMADT